MNRGNDRGDLGKNDPEWWEERRVNDRKRMPAGSKEVMRRVMKGLAVRVPGWDTQSIFSRWEEIVGGEERARAAQPVSLSEEGTLVIRAEHYAVRTEIQFAAQEIIRRANTVVGTTAVHRIVFEGVSSRKS